MAVRITRLFILLISGVWLLGCDSQAPDQTQTRPSSPAAQTKGAASPFYTYLELNAYTALSQATQQAQYLDQQLSALLHQPDSTHLVQAQSAWRQAYDAYLRTLIYAHLPLTDPVEWHQKGIDYHTTLTLIDSWPIAGGYIDHVPGYPFSGIVNDLTLALTAENLLAQHRFSDSSYVSLGYHALEFMLWGANGNRNPQDFLAQENTAPVVMPSEGVRPDNTTTQTAHSTHIKNHPIQNHHRRRHYVQLLSEQLQEHLHRLQRRWQPGNGYYAERLAQARNKQRLYAVLVASQSLLSTEILDRRLGANSSEFSNTGIDDVIAIYQGLKPLLIGENQQQDGLINRLNDELQTNWQQQLNALQHTLARWQEQGPGNATLNQQLRQQLIGLLSLLAKTASALNLHLPEAN